MGQGLAMAGVNCIVQGYLIVTRADLPDAASRSVVQAASVLQSVNTFDAFWMETVTCSFFTFRVCAQFVYSLMTLV